MDLAQDACAGAEHPRPELAVGCADHGDVWVAVREQPTRAGQGRDVPSRSRSSARDPASEAVDLHGVEKRIKRSSRSPEALSFPDVTGRGGRTLISSCVCEVLVVQRQRLAKGAPCLRARPRRLPAGAAHPSQHAASCVLCSRGGRLPSDGERSVLMTILRDLGCVINSAPVV